MADSRDLSVWWCAMHIRVVVLGGIAVLLLAAACSSETGVTNEPQSTDPLATEPSNDLPEFLDLAWPWPGTSVKAIDYQTSLTSAFVQQRGIGVAVWADEVDVPGVDADQTIPQRTSLFVDGQAISAELMQVANGLQVENVYDSEGNLLYTIDQGPYYLSWAVELGLGEHDAKIVIEREADMPLEFTWTITLVE